MIIFGYTITYVPDVATALSFYEEAFGFSRRFLHDSGEYGELETGATTLAFASHTLGESHFPQGYVPASGSEKPLGMEIDLIATDVDTAHQKAIEHGATEVTAPEEKPWGQRVSYIRCPAGILVALGSPMKG